MKKLFYFSLFIFSFSFTDGQSWLWAKAAVNDSSQSYNWNYDLATDDLGNVYQAGAFEGRISFGADTLNTSIFTTDAFLTKFDNNGNALWGIAPSLVGYSYSYGLTTATNKHGKIALAGYYGDSMSIGAHKYSKNKNTSLFVAVFNSNGTIKWGANSTLQGVKGVIVPNSVALDDSGNTYLTGYFTDTVALGSVKLSSSDFLNLFVAKYDTAGNLAWVQTGTPKDKESIGVTLVTDSAGNVYVTGGFADTLTIGSTSITTVKYGEDMFLAKFTSGGTLTWIKSATLPSYMSYYYYNNSGRLLSIDKAGNLYLTGGFTDTIQFGPYPLYGNSYGIFIAKYSPAGNVIWAKANSPASYTAAKQYYPFSISCSKYRSFYLSGTFGDSIGYNSVEVKSDSAYPPFVFKFDTSGKALCGAAIDRSYPDNNCVSANPLADNAFFSGTLDTASTRGTGCRFDTTDLTGINLFTFLAKWQSCSIPSGINDVKNESGDVKVFPNPNNGLFTIALSHPAAIGGSQTITIYKKKKKKIMTDILSFTQNDNTLDLSGQPSGIYFYRALDENGGLLGEGKIIVQR